MTEEQVAEIIDTQNTGSEVADSTQAQPESSTPEAGNSTETQNTPQTTEEIIDWLKDKRAETSWKKDPNRLYKSYRDMEKTYSPMKQKFESLNKTFQELGIAPEHLKEMTEELKTWKDPENPTVKRAQYLDRWLNNPQYANQVLAYFEDLEKKDIQAKYPNMTQDQIEKQVALEQKLEKLEKAESDRQFQSEVKTELEMIDSGIKEAKEVANSYGFEFSKEIEQFLLKHCDEQGKSGDMIPYYFQKLYRDQILKAQQDKLEKDFLARSEKTKKAVVVPATGTAPKPQGATPWRESMIQALKGKK